MGRTTADWIRGFASQGMSQEEILGLLGTTRFQIANALNRKVAGWGGLEHLPGCERCGAKPYAQVPSMAGAGRRCGACGAHYRTWAGEAAVLRNRYLTRCEKCGSAPSRQDPLKVGKLPIRKNAQRCSACGASGVAWKHRRPVATEEIKPPATADERSALWEIIARSKAKRVERRLVLQTKAQAKAKTEAQNKVREDRAAELEAELAAAREPTKTALKREANVAEPRVLKLIQPKRKGGRPQFPCGTIAVVGARDPAQPRTRADCINGARPCPWNTCRYHLDAPPSCALDVVDQNPDGATLDIIGSLFSISRERVRQIEQEAFAKLREQLGPEALARLLTTL